MSYLKLNVFCILKPVSLSVFVNLLYGTTLQNIIQTTVLEAALVYYLVYSLTTNQPHGHV